MKKFLILLVVLIGLAFISACADNDEAAEDGSASMLSIMNRAQTCTPNQSAQCLCQEEGTWGLQECQDGVWGACDCSANKPELIPEVIFGGIFFSEYLEGTSNNKAIEVHNASAKTAECTIKLFPNGNTKATSSVHFTIEPGATGAFCNSGASTALKARCFGLHAVASFNGDDALELICDDMTVDVFGHIGTKPSGNAWKQGNASTADMTLRRKASILVGQTNTDPAFTSLGTEWEVFAIDTFDGIGVHVVEASTVDPTDPEDPVIVEPEPDIAEWTFMVFMNGDNNLYEYAASDFKEMQKITSTDSSNIIVLYDDYGPKNTNLYRVTPGGKELLDSGTEIFKNGEADMGDWKTLREFGRWSVKNYPAKRYALVLWNHGSGPKDGEIDSPLFKEFSNDENGTYSGILLSNGDYAKALDSIVKEAGQKLDIVGFDACLMAMYETAVATAPYAKLLVASEETEPANGWSYDKFLQPLGKNPTMDAVTFSKSIVDTYHAAGSDNATLSVMDLSTMDQMNTKLDAFADALIAENAKESIKSIRNGLMEMAVADHVDLRQFVQKVATTSSMSSSMKVAANALDAQLGETILYERAHNYYDSYYRQSFYYDTNTFGMAVYFPKKKNNSDWNYYKKGVWYSETSWADFLSNNF